MTKQECYNEAVKLNEELNKYRDNAGNFTNFDEAWKILEKVYTLTGTVKELYGKDEEMFILTTATCRQ